MKSVNIISLLLFVSLFLFTPFDGFKKLIILAGLFMVWMVSAIAINGKAFTKTFPLIGLLLVIMGLNLMYSYGGGHSDQFRRFFTQFFWTYVWGVLGVYYAKNLVIFKKCLPFVIIMIAVSCVYTIIGNLAIPGASRMIAGSESEGSQMYYLIHSMHIGGYDFIYAIMFAILPCSIWARKKIGYFFISIAYLALLFGTLLVGSYFTSIILATVIVLFSVSDTRKLSTYIIVIGILFVFVFIFKDYLLRALMDFGALIDSQMLQNRAQEMLEGTYQESYDEVGDYSRVDRMLNALHNISQSPLFGKLFTQPADIRPSGHSELLGYFEQYGLFGIVYVYYYYSVMKKIRLEFMSKEMSLRFRIFSILFFLFITINTFDVANATGCMALFLAPCMMLYIDRKVQTEGSSRLFSLE